MKEKNAGAVAMLALLFGLHASAQNAPAPAQAAAPSVTSLRQMEKLGRGVVAINQGAGKVFVSWRILGTDPDELAFNLYRATGDGAPKKLNQEPLRHSNFADTEASLEQPTAYFVRPLLQGQELPPSAPFKFPPHAPARPYLAIPLQTPEGYSPNDASVGDLDGDGEYEIVLHQASRGRDNAQAGLTSPPVLQAYKLDGTLLWSIHLGQNIREGAHYTQFMVYDLDGDGQAEVVCKTADGTKDGVGKIIGDPQADYRVKEGRAAGKILSGPEYLTVFDGPTGKALATTNYVPPRGDGADWGDDYGNRVDRFLACVAYLDGERPSVVLCRGYYTRTVLAAWDWRPGKLTLRWLFDSDRHGPPDATNPYRGQGDHCLSVGDVDGDGKDEIVFGAMCLDDDGQPLYSTRLGHGDALHLSDLDPDRPGLEVFNIHERPKHPNGAEFRDARTGKLIWGKPGGTEPAPDVGRGVVMDIDPRHRGYESWAAGLTGVWNVKGETISRRKPRSCNFGVWWDGDLPRELLDRNYIAKWNWETETETVLLTAEDCVANNGTKANPCLCADLLGDWREEVLWRTADHKELRLYTTTIPTTHRLYTLMHDPQYRLSVTWQNVAYNQPTQPGFYLGEGMAPPPRPKIRLVGP
jgi:rhamnogalacturonan endolyase